MAQNPYDTPSHQASQPVHQHGIRTVALKRLDIASTGVMLGALYALIGLIVGAFFTLFAVMGIAIGGGGGDAAMGGIIGGVGALIFLPLFYGIAGFIGGVILALLYNVVASAVGGLKFDLEG